MPKCMPDVHKIMRYYDFRLAAAGYQAAQSRFMMRCAIRAHVREVDRRTDRLVRRCCKTLGRLRRSDVDRGVTYGIILT